MIHNQVIVRWPMADVSNERLAQQIPCVEVFFALLASIINVAPGKEPTYRSPTVVAGKRRFQTSAQLSLIRNFAVGDSLPAGMIRQTE